MRQEAANIGGIRRRRRMRAMCSEGLSLNNSGDGFSNGSGLGLSLFSLDVAPGFLPNAGQYRKMNFKA